ncbi:unnamed protein product [Linum trigynum]|uniref:Uncharacterized protein n=1 Tax=Linum trigynum TaxID=586398 RepID=A0AAV2E8W7_9ROSI
MAAAALFFLVPTLALFVAATQVSNVEAVTYPVINMAPGTKCGILFDTQIGLNFTTTTMSSASDFSWQTFQQNASADRQSLPQVSLFIDSDVQEIAYHDYQAAQIYIDADYLANLTSSNDDDLRREFAGLVYAQMASVGRGEVGPRGRRYGQVLGVLRWVEERELCGGDQFHDEGHLQQWLLRELLGKDVADVWKYYKAKYGNLTAS